MPILDVINFIRRRTWKVVLQALPAP